jgi:predicted RND superfamily exporter protein
VFEGRDWEDTGAASSYRSLGTGAYSQAGTKDSPLFLTFTTFISILYTLSLAYFFYTFVCGVAFFPFMNVLATVIAIGVGADDTFILVKAWTSQHPEIRKKSKHHRATSIGNTGKVRNQDDQSHIIHCVGDTGNQEEVICRNKFGEDELIRMVKATLKHSTLTISVTSITTSVAFFASFISNVTAIKCFSIFAGIAIICNFLLMVTWTPAAFVFDGDFEKD